MASTHREPWRLGCIGLPAAPVADCGCVVTTEFTWSVDALARSAFYEGNRVTIGPVPRSTSLEDSDHGGGAGSRVDLQSDDCHALVPSDRRRTVAVLAGLPVRTR